MIWSWSYGSWVYIYLTISAYHHFRCEFEPSSWRAILDTTICYQVCQWLVTGLSFSPGPPLSSTNKTDCHDKTEILLKVALNTISLYLNCIGVIVISAFTSSVVAIDRGLDTRTHQVKGYKIGICYGRVSSSCYNSGNRHATLVIKVMLHLL